MDKAREPAINVQGLFIDLCIISVYVCVHTCHCAHHMEEDKACGESSLLTSLSQGSED